MPSCASLAATIRSIGATGTGGTALSKTLPAGPAAGAVPGTASAANSGINQRVFMRDRGWIYGPTTLLVVSPSMNLVRSRSPGRRVAADLTTLPSAPRVMENPRWKTDSGPSARSSPRRRTSRWWRRSMRVLAGAHQAAPHVG